MSESRALILTANEDPPVGRIIRSVLAEMQIQTIDLTDVPPGAVWVSAISDAMHSADLLIVDLTNQTSNLMFELGIAHALRKPTLILVSRQSRARLPSDLAGLTFVVYDPTKPDELVERLKQYPPMFVPTG